MRILADENIPRNLVGALVEQGHDVLAVSEDRPSTQDVDVLGLARAQSRLLVTLDKDFGELAFHSELPAECGIVLLRLPNSPRQIREGFLQALAAGVEFAGWFTVIEPARIRQRPL